VVRSSSMSMKANRVERRLSLLMETIRASRSNAHPRMTSERPLMSFLGARASFPRSVTMTLSTAALLV